MPARSYIRPVLVDNESPFQGEDCALCKEAFATGDEIVICPDDGSRHHVHCWRANGNRCTAYGCTGFGDVLPRQSQPRTRRQSRVVTQGEAATRSKVRAMPSSSIGCAQACLIVSIAIAIVLIAAGCFGLWAIADYILIEELGWQYRSPFTGMILPAMLMVDLQSLLAILLV
jgi:hypothetical protein